MRSRSPRTAVQLRSAAGRYRRRVRHDERQPYRSLLHADVAESDAEEEEEGRGLKLRRLEAVLFLTREALNSRKLAQYANLADGTQARTLIRRLNHLYDEAGRAFRVEEVAGGYQLMTRPMFSNWLRRLQHVPPEVRLSAPAMETLAVVAYRQPVLRADVGAIRGGNCGEILRQLMHRDLVRIGGRSEELGRPYLYATTKRFLQLFGLTSLDRLPRADQMHSSATQDDEEKDEKESQVTATEIAEQIDELLELPGVASRVE